MIMSDTMASMDEQSAKPPSQRLRYGLLWLLVLSIALIVIPLGFNINRAMNQRNVVAKLLKLDARLTYDYEISRGQNGGQANSSPGPGWLTDLFGKEYFADVLQVSVGDTRTDEALGLIAKLPNVQHVTAAGITDNGLIPFAALHNLEGVALFSDRITGNGIVHLAGLKRLKFLWISGSITDSYLENVSKLSQLEHLEICSGQLAITDDGFSHIAKLTNLRSLGFGHDDWNGSSILAPVKVTDKGLTSLHRLKRLEALHLNTTTQITQAGIDKLGKDLPNCRIRWSPNGTRGAGLINGGDGVSPSKAVEVDPWVD